MTDQWDTEGGAPAKNDLLDILEEIERRQYGKYGYRACAELFSDERGMKRRCRRRRGHAGRHAGTLIRETD